MVDIRNMRYELPFVVTHACKHSVTVELGDGTTAFCSIKNLVHLMQNPAASFKIIEKPAHRSITRHINGDIREIEYPACKWIAVAIYSI